MSQYSQRYYFRKVRRFDSGIPEEWIIFVDLVLKSLVGQNVTTGPPMYECIERVLKGDAKAEFFQQANSVGSCTVAKNYYSNGNYDCTHLPYLHLS